MTRALAIAACLAASGLALQGCIVPQTVESLDSYDPPPEFGRPGWVRTTARAGALVGGIGGAVASLVLLPINWPLSKLASSSFSEPAEQEFLFYPVVVGASGGHFLLGAPADVLDFVFRRAWIDEEPEADAYQLVPMEPPMGPQWRLPDEPAEAPGTGGEQKQGREGR